MDTLDKLQRLLPGDVSEQIGAWRERLYEVRMRGGRPVQLRSDRGEWLSGVPIDAEAMNRALAALMDYSVYAKECELGQGYFTLEDGCRVGVCGRLIVEEGRVKGIGAVGSVCIRMAREVHGCAEPVIHALEDGAGGLRSTLILSRPGFGKTTLLREVARRLSEAGRNVCIADDRHELAACRRGVPTLDVGMRTDVMDECPKHIAIPYLLRAMSPQVIVCDEIGDTADARALTEAVRCGVAVICSAHAGSFEQLYQRRLLREAADVFTLGVRLDEKPGHISEIRTIGEEWHAFRVGAVRRGGLYTLRKRHGVRGAAQGEAVKPSDSWHSSAARAHDSNAGACGRRAGGL